ncbi:MAG: hypothetical protein ACM3UY_01900 [Methanocella sp.]
MVEIEVRKEEPTGKTQTADIDINEIVSKVRGFIDTIKSMQDSGEPMKVAVEGFNIAFAKEHGEYEFTLKLNLTLKPQSQKCEV